MDIDWDAKVLSSLDPVVSNLKEVQINNQEIENVADWLASVSYTHLTLPTNREV